MTAGDTRRWSALKRVQQHLREDVGLARPTAYRLVRTAAALSAPRETLRRRGAAGRLAAEPVQLGPIPRADGFLRFAAGDVPGAGGAAEACRRLFAQLRADAVPPALRPGYQKQDFLVPLLRGESFGAHPELLRFVLSPAILQAVTRYLGEVPVLAKMSLLWSPENASARSSQLFHHDLEDMTQLKLFLHVLDVDEGTGPFTLLPADASRRVTERTGYDGGRIDDASVAAAGASDAVTTITGPSGSGVLVDTSRCLHFGSRGNRRERLMLMAQYLRYGAPNFKPTRWWRSLPSPEFEPGPLERMLLLV